MAKKRIISIIFLSVFLSLVLNIFAGRFLAAKISTWPLLNRWKILSPQAPIVITNRETVRISDGGDVLEAAALTKSRISTLVKVNGTGLATVGSAINLTSDGSFVTAAASFFDKNVGSYFVVLNDGRLAQVAQRVLDPATTLVFFKAALDNVATANLGSSKDLLPGDKVIFAQNSLQNFSNKIVVNYINFSQSDVEGRAFESDYPRRSFGAMANTALANGEALINTNGDVVGLWNGSEIISSDVLKQAVALYFNNPLGLKRPQFGFSYQIISPNNSKLTSLPEGALVREVAFPSPARVAGLLSGDILTAVEGQQIKENSSLEEILQKYKAGDKVLLTIVRRDQIVTLSLVAGELK